VQLGYAATIHGAQGVTVDATHTVVTGTESRQGLYVALSRGRHENHLYLSDVEPAPAVVALDLPADRGPREVLTGILARDDRAETATRASAAHPARELAHAIKQYEDALPLLAVHVIGDRRMRVLDSALERWMPGLTDRPGYSGLRGQIALRWVDGESPDEILRQATWWQDKAALSQLEDPAWALAKNVARAGPMSVGGGPITWLPRVPDQIRSELEVGNYLGRLSTRIQELAPSVIESPTSDLPHDARQSEKERRLGRFSTVPGRHPPVAKGR
jgi:hypothetical protein